MKTKPIKLTILTDEEMADRISEMNNLSHFISRHIVGNEIMRRITIGEFSNSVEESYIDTNDILFRQRDLVNKIKLAFPNYSNAIVSGCNYFIEYIQEC